MFYTAATTALQTIERVTPIYVCIREYFNYDDDDKPRRLLRLCRGHRRTTIIIPCIIYTSHQCTHVNMLWAHKRVAEAARRILEVNKKKNN